MLFNSSRKRPQLQVLTTYHSYCRPLNIIHASVTYIQHTAATEKQSKLTSSKKKSNALSQQQQQQPKKKTLGVEGTLHIISQ